MQKGGAVAGLSQILQQSGKDSPTPGDSGGGGVSAPSSFNPVLNGKLLEEVDPDLGFDTFCVISKKHGRQTYVNRFSTASSLFILGPENPCRQFAIFITTSPWFETLIILTILANCGALATGQNVWEVDESGRSRKVIPSYEATLNKIEYGFLGIYTIEMMLKILAKGFVLHKYSYLRNPWNILDFVIVWTAYFAIIWESLSASGSVGSEFEVLRTFRVLRIVKTISILPGLRTILQSLLGSVVQLLEVVALAVVSLMIFALFGLKLYLGKFRQKCVQNFSSSRVEEETNVSWEMWVNNESNWLTRDFPKEEFQVCGNETGTRPCPSGYVCLPDRGGNPDEGWTSFDNFFISCMSTFQLMTQDTWERIYELVVSTAGKWNVLYFAIVVFFGSYYLLNLMFAVVATSYQSEANKSREAPLSNDQKLRLVRSNSTFNINDLEGLNIKKMTPAYLNGIYPTVEMMLRRDKNGSDLEATGSSHHENQTTATNTTRNLEEAGTVKSDRNDSILVLETVVEPDFSPTQNKATRGSDNETPHPSKCQQLVAFAAGPSSRLEPIVNHWLVEAAMVSCIVANTTILACERHGQPLEEKRWMEYANTGFLCVFVVEAIVKILAFGKNYFHDGWNIFDLIVVVVNVVDLILIQFDLNLSVIRGMRLLRVFKLGKSWTTMRTLLKIIFSTWGAVGNLLLVLLMVLYIFSVSAMTLIGGNYVPEAFEGAYPKWNFSNFGHSFMMIFRVLCGQYLDVLSDCLVAHKFEKPRQQWKCFLIFWSVMIVGNFIVLNLFLALLLNNFNSDELGQEKEESQEIQKSAESPEGMQEVALESVNNDAEVKSDENSPPTTILSAGKINFTGLVRKTIAQNRQARGNQQQGSENHGNRPLAEYESRSTLNVANSSPTPSQLKSEARLQEPDNCIPWEAACSSLNCTLVQDCPKPWLWVKTRQFCCTIVFHPAFDWIILALIFISSISLAFEDKYLNEKPSLKMVLFYLNLIFAIIFTIEMLLKWFALGLWNYFTNPWNILDATIVVISLLSVAQDFEEMATLDIDNDNGRLAAFKALRTLRAFRPLRVISRWEGMKIVVNAIIVAIPAIFNVLVVCLLFWLVFSIMGVQLFKGKFYKCVDERGNPVDSMIVSHRQFCCHQNNTDKYSWINTNPNFDNVLEGYLALFQVATFAGWIEVMGSAVDSTEVDFQPVADNGTEYYLFFVLFIVFGSFFTLNLFVGVIIDNFNKQKKKYEGNLLELFCTPSQQRYCRTMKKLGKRQPSRAVARPANKFAYPFYEIALSRRTEIAIFVMIFADLAVMGSEHYGQSQLFGDTLAAVNSFFTAVYALEAVVKIIGLRHHYFTIPWNVFDFTLVLASIADLLISDLPIPPTLLRVLRVCRIGRVIRLVKGAKGIRKLLFALIVSLPALFNIGALLGLITFVYAILGMALFQDVPHYNTVDDLFNFETFFNSFLMLFRLMTASGWNNVFDALANEIPTCGTFRKIHCGGQNEPKCVSRGLTIAYCVSYIVITTLIVINMYVAIILENFAEANLDEEVEEDDVDMFYEQWGRFDPKATQFIKFEELSHFLESLDPPFTIPAPNLEAIAAFNLPISKDNKIHCLDILRALVKHLLGEIEDSQEFRKIQAGLEEKFQKRFPPRQVIEFVSSTRQRKLEHDAATIIQKHWRIYCHRKLAS